MKSPICIPMMCASIVFAAGAAQAQIVAWDDFAPGVRSLEISPTFADADPKSYEQLSVVSPGEHAPVWNNDISIVRRPDVASNVKNATPPPGENGLHDARFLAALSGESAIETRQAAPVAHRNTGFLDLNYYWDTRDSTVFTFNAGAKLPHDFEYFQFLNASSPFGSGSTNMNAYYTEINLRRPVWKEHPWLEPFDWTVQIADGTFSDHVFRFGARLRVQDAPGKLGHFVKDVLKLRLSASFHAVETDGTGWQMEYAYRRDFFEKRMYVGGFCDHNIDDGLNSSWVTEHQVGVRLFDQWHAVAEYRYSSFAAEPYKSGLGMGIEYVMVFK